MKIGKEKVKFWMLYQRLRSITFGLGKEKRNPNFGAALPRLPRLFVHGRGRVIQSLLSFRCVVMLRVRHVAFMRAKKTRHRDKMRQNTTNRDIVSHLWLDGADTS